jgi:hypothetical protein
VSINLLFPTADASPSGKVENQLKGTSDGWFVQSATGSRRAWRDDLYHFDSFRLGDNPLKLLTVDGKADSGGLRPSRTASGATWRPTAV